METITTTQYKAFDGTIFNDSVQCERYESSKNKELVSTFRNFPITFPMQDQVTDCRAYLIQSEKEFDAFIDFVVDRNGEYDKSYEEYGGAGWYVLQEDDCGYASVYKLSDIIHDWSLVLDKIAQNTMELKED